MAVDIFISEREARQAERDGLQQRLAFGPLLRMDETRVAHADRALAEKVLRLAHRSSPEFDSLLSDPQVNRLFVTGALFFPSTR